MTMVELYTHYSVEMGTDIAVLRDFWAIRETLARIEACLVMRLDLRLVRFTDALGMTMGLPYQACLTGLTFRGLIGVIFTDRPG